MKHNLPTHSDKHQTDPPSPWASCAGWKLLLLLPLAALLLVIRPLDFSPLQHSSPSLARWSPFKPCHRGPLSAQRLSLNKWIEEERDVSWWGILSNIGPAAGAKPGLVVASPSRAHPDYFYSWTRDSALTFSTIFDRFVPYANGSVYAHADYSLEPLIREYVSSQGALQLLETPSGSLLDGGLGEPKYKVDGTAFTGSWGRPQRDGPPLRALVVARYADFLLKRGEPLDGEYVRANLYNPSKLISRGSILKSDLEYVAHNWNKTSFDLWEEINGHHFFTLLSSYRALKHGAALALDMDDPLASDFYQKQADSIALKLESFWLSDDGYVTATLDAGSFGRSGLDAAVLLAVLHVGGKDDEPWSATDDRVLATIVRFVQSFEHGLYAINEGEGRKGWKGAIAVGRYMEDVYDGDGKSKANPWFIATYGVSQILYRITVQSLSTGQISISPVSLPFWQYLNPSVDLEPNTVLTSSDDKFKAVVRALVQRAEGFLLVGKTFEGPGGTMTEQYHQLDGSPTGAKNLTWSYSSFIDATNVRQEFHVLRQPFL